MTPRVGESAHSDSKVVSKSQSSDYLWRFTERASVVSTNTVFVDREK
jgi:hypothetical protein